MYLNILFIKLQTSQSFLLHINRLEKLITKYLTPVNPFFNWIILYENPF